MEDIDPAKTTLDLKKIEAVLGRKGEISNGVYKITIGRTAKMHGHTVGNTIGVSTWLPFVGSNEQAIVDGDFAMLASELQGVLKALREAGIDVVTIHNHMKLFDCRFNSETADEIINTATRATARTCVASCF